VASHPCWSHQRASRPSPSATVSRGAPRSSSARSSSPAAAAALRAPGKPGCPAQCHVASLPSSRASNACRRIAGAIDVAGLSPMRSKRNPVSVEGRPRPAAVISMPAAGSANLAADAPDRDLAISFSAKPAPSNASGVAEGSAGSILASTTSLQKPPFSLKFSYVCPEPVLVN
jgi:hypothetical protein